MRGCHMNRPEFFGGFWSWERGWSHAEGTGEGEADDASLLGGGEGRRGADGQDTASRAGCHAGNGEACRDAAGLRG